jgi:rhodanese-related sulfurtransferase
MPNVVLTRPRGRVRITFSARAAASGIMGPMTRTIDDLLAAARARLDRVDPHRVAALVAEGAILVDTRPQWQRADEGELPGALLIERNHLEWRLDPASDARIPQATDHDVTWIVVCSEGYSSSLAAASLQDLGLRNATDLAGGFRAWSRECQTSL